MTGRTRVAIIGGGLAGTACAHVLKLYGAQPEIYEAGKELASGASGNVAGLYNPRLSAERTPESDYYAAAFVQALTTFKTLEGTYDIGLKRCGSLHLFTDEKKRRRYAKTASAWGWDSEHMRRVSREEASEIAGVEVPYESLYLPDAGCVSPRKLCAAYAQDVPVHLNKKIGSLRDIEADAVVLACGTQTREFGKLGYLPLKAVRGQITKVKATEKTKNLKTNLCYGGYFSPALSGDMEGMHVVGSTFQRWLDHTNVVEKDDEDNIAKLAEVVPDLSEGLKAVPNKSRAGLRTSSPDYMPLIGGVPGYDNLYISVAHGSHGVISSIMGAHVLAAMITGAPLPLPQATLEKTDPGRF